MSTDPATWHGIFPSSDSVNTFLDEQVLVPDGQNDTISGFSVKSR